MAFIKILKKKKKPYFGRNNDIPIKLRINCKIYNIYIC